jgi:hypothetical protein
MKKAILLIAFTSLCASLNAQPVTFPSSQLQAKAKELSGSEMNWPLLLNMAEHDRRTNQFTLPAESVLRLRNFSRTTEVVNRSRERINELIQEGAAVFALDELSEVNGVLNNYMNEVKNGNIDSAYSIATLLPPSIENLDSVLTENRLVDIQAQLVSKEGNVDKRAGILGSWEDAFEGDLFKESDGIKTYTESYANMTFVDGSSIVINPGTEAVIRKSTIDKLNESADTEITLVEGALLSKLSGSGKEKGKFVLFAGNSETDLNTLNFLAETDAESRVKLTNYDGEANVKANDLTITIRKNEGTIVEEGKDPLPPIKLLPEPQLEDFVRDTIIYTDQHPFSFKAVDGAVSYHIQVGNTSGFDDDVTDINTTETSLLLNGSNSGTNYVHVQAIDELGLKGPYSRIVRFIRNEDNQPPPLYLSGVTGGLLFTLASETEITGTTELDAEIRVGGQKAEQEANGSFRYPVQTNPVDQQIRVESSDDSGNKTTKTVRLVRLTSEVLFNLNVQGAILGENLRIQKNPVTISGFAYPSLEVEIVNRDIVQSVKTDSRGRWGITLPLSGEELTIRFRNAHTGIEYASETYTIQNN